MEEEKNLLKTIILTFFVYHCKNYSYKKHYAQMAQKKPWCKTKVLTYVLSRHSQKCELDGLHQKKITVLALQSWKLTLLFLEINFQVINFEEEKIVRAFDLILRLRARPKYKLSYGNTCPDFLQLYLVWLRFLSSSSTFGYAQPWWGDPQSNAIKASTALMP